MAARVAVTLIAMSRTEFVTTWIHLAGASRLPRAVLAPTRDADGWDGHRRFRLDWAGSLVSGGRSMFQLKLRGRSADTDSI